MARAHGAGRIGRLLLSIGLSAGFSEVALSDPAAPEVEALAVAGTIVWVAGQGTPARLRTGEVVTVRGRRFGAGPDVDFAKLLLGNVRALERDLVMYRGAVDLLKQLFHETADPFDRWSRDLREWTDDRIVFRVPELAGAFPSAVPLVVSVQRRRGALADLRNPSTAHVVFDPLTERIDETFAHRQGTVDILTEPLVSEPVPVQVGGARALDLVAEGEAIYWASEINMGLVHHLRGLDWEHVLSGRAKDPVTGLAADPRELFGALRTVAGEVPEVALGAVDFERFPAPMPLKPLLGKPLLAGRTEPTGWVGYVYAEARGVAGNRGKWIGFGCAACHSQRITYEASPGRTVTKVFPGIPNPRWTMKWNVLSDMHGVKGKESGPTADSAKAAIDKTQLLYSMPAGTGEHSLVREASDGSRYANDHLYSPIAIPVITRHTPVRRALARTELIAGFEGSYIHAQEPDGSIGALRADAVRALTAYMATLDGNDATLERVGLYRWLARNGLLDDIDGAAEGQLVQRGKEAFPRLTDRIRRGQRTFARDCQTCHQPNFGTWTDENMLSLADVGTFFSPTIFHRETQSIRTAILRNLFWLEGRGYLHDGHVRSLEDLVDPRRCVEGTALYDRYYTLSAEAFRVRKGDAAQERATRRHGYFVEIPGDAEHLYWDYQKMRREFGPRELGTAAPIPLPAAPHPWCAGTPGEVQDLVSYLLTL